MVTTRTSNGKKKQHINRAIPYLEKKARRRMSDSKPGKATIPLALRQQVWKTYIGPKFESKCLIRWCSNRITAFEFHVGHNIPESKGGTLDISNLRPICRGCNASMSNTYTIDEWNKLSKPVGCGLWCC